MSDKTVPASPLDRFLAPFLQAVGLKPAGFLPGPQSKQLAGELGLEREFIDALFTSARTRGLLKPAYGRGSKVHWKLSQSGEAFIATHAKP